jgi:transposase
VLELRVAQDGGIPFVRQRWDGNTSAPEMVQARAQAVLLAFQQAPPPRDLIADATRYHEDNATSLRHLDFITRLPTTSGAVAEAITQALALACWPRLDDQTRDQRLELCHDGLAQRWLVGYAQAAYERAAVTRNHARQRESEAIHPQLLHLQAKRVATPDAAHAALTALAQGWRDHQVNAYHRSEHQRDARKGRPTPRLPVKASAWQIHAHVQPAEAAIEHQKHHHAWFVIGTNIGTGELQETEVITAYKRQSQGAGGCRCLNDPLVFVSSLCGTKPGRIQGLLRVMTLAFLVSAVAQRRWRQQVAPHQETVPNQINPPTTSPTLRGVFQLLEGMHRVRLAGQGHVHALIEGLNDVQITVLRLLGEDVCRLYHISPG